MINIEYLEKVAANSSAKLRDALGKQLAKNKENALNPNMKNAIHDYLLSKAVYDREMRNQLGKSKRTKVERDVYTKDMEEIRKKLKGE